HATAMPATSSTSSAEVSRHAQLAPAAGGTSLAAAAQELFVGGGASASSCAPGPGPCAPGSEEHRRERVVRTLLADRVRARVLETTLDVVRRRWSEQEDILDALELLGVTALLDQAQTEGVLEQVEAELFEVTQLIDGSGELTAALDGERDDPARRATLLERLLDGRTHRLTTALAARAVGRRTEIKPARRVEEFARFASDRRRRAF